MNLVMQPTQPISQALPDLGIKRPERLIEQQHFRLNSECSGERNALTLTTGKLHGIAASESI